MCGHYLITSVCVLVIIPIFIVDKIEKQIKTLEWIFKRTMFYLSKSLKNWKVVEFDYYILFPWFLWRHITVQVSTLYLVTKWYIFTCYNYVSKKKWQRIGDQICEWSNKQHRYLVYKNTLRCISIVITEQMKFYNYSEMIHCTQSSPNVE